MSPGTTPAADVLVVGAGPAGRSVARACAVRGLATTVVDPRPDAPWRHTYGVWSHELPADVPPDVVAAGGHGTAIALRAHELADHYAVLATPALQAHLTHPAVRSCAGRVVGADGDGALLDDGTTLSARAVVDATGARQVLSLAPSRRRDAAEQTAYGVIVDRSLADRVTGGRLLFMDWRPLHGAPGWPTFLYAVPLDADRVLLEETSLARRPGLPLDELRARLHARLRASGLGDDEIPTDRERTERVRFPVDSPTHVPPHGVVAVGAAAPLVHPASGYSLSTSLRMAPLLAEALAGPDPVAAGRRVVRSPGAVAVHALRHRGLDVLLRMPPADVPAFFDRFFTMPADHQRAYLDAREDVPRSLSAMWALFGRLSPRLRTHLVVGSVLGPGWVRTDHSR